jgi:hypothetical protein
MQKQSRFETQSGLAFGAAMGREQQMCCEQLFFIVNEQETIR